MHWTHMVKKLPNTLEREQEKQWNTKYERQHCLEDMKKTTTTANS